MHNDLDDLDDASAVLLPSVVADAIVDVFAVCLLVVFTDAVVGVVVLVAVWWRFLILSCLMS